MARDKDLSHSLSFCFFDGKHGRVQGMKTLTASVFHLGLRRMIRLAVMHCENEDESKVSLFWKLFNEALKLATGDLETVFKPYGYMMDEGGAEWAGLLKACGDEEVQRANSCQFHYKQAVNRETGKLGSSKSKFEFKRLANTLLTAKSPAAYDKAYGDLAKFINEKPSKRGVLKPWLDWWDERKHHVFDAFRTLPFMPTTNLSECLHSSWETTHSSKLSLIDAIYDDVADCVKFARQVVLVGGGSLAPAEGITHKLAEAREREMQRRKALHYGQELTSSSSLTLHDEANDCNSFQIDPNCTHRHDKRTKNKGSSKNQTKSTRKSSYDQSTSSPSDLSDSSSEELEPAEKKQTQTTGPSTKRGGRFRKHRSKQFNKNLSKAKKQKTRISVVNSSVIDSLHRAYVVTSAQVEDHSLNYEVHVSKEPSCNCPQGLRTKKDVCKHIIWVCLFVLKVPESSSMLNQVYLTEKEVEQIFHNAPSLSTMTGNLEEQIAVDVEVQPRIYPPASEAVQRNPFVIKFLQANVKVCAGCPRPNNSFRANEVEPLPPYNIVICHKEIRTWKENGEIRQSPTLQNTYYHADMSCIRKNNPDFVNSMIVIPTSVKKELKPEHKIYLHQYFEVDIL